MKRGIKRGYTGGNNNNNTNKQPYHHRPHLQHTNPKRGYPGILFTCETGRENKAKREGLDILLQDWEQHYGGGEIIVSPGNKAPKHQQPHDNNHVASTDSTGNLPADDDIADSKTNGIAQNNNNNNNNNSHSLGTRDPLDVELEQLRGANNIHVGYRSRGGERTYESSTAVSSPPFTVYETGCKGTVFIFCTASQWLVPPRPKSQQDNNDTLTALSSSPQDGPTNSNASIDIQSRGDGVAATNDEKALMQDNSKEDVAIVDSHGAAARPQGCDGQDSGVIVWDPFAVVQRIVYDTTSGTNQLMSSRFINRMIPMQTTCYSSIEDIQYAVTKLLEPIVQGTTKKVAVPEDDESGPDSKTQQKGQSVTTFAIHEKRRFCGHLKHDQIVEAVGSVVTNMTVDNAWKVNLTTPDYTMWIEICKTVAGISIVPAMSLQPKNFNIAELKVAAAVAETATEDDETTQAATPPSTTTTTTTSETITTTAAATQDQHSATTSTLAQPSEGTEVNNITTPSATNEE